jgi:uncharacterized protein YaaN involved in tellurite resistance
MSIPVATVDASTPFVLTPPEVIQPLVPAAANHAVPLGAELKDAVEDQVGHFIAGLLAEDLHGDGFKARLDSAFALGREEVSIAATLMQGRFMKRNLVGIESSAAYRAISDMRLQLDALDPGREGDLFTQQKLLGLIPFGNKLKAYFRRYQTAGSQIEKSMHQLYAARDEMQRDVVDIEATRTTLWEAMQKLSAAIHFAENLDARLAGKVESLAATDPERARALQQEVLFYARQNLQDMLTQQAVCTNGYLALDVLKRSGREMMNGCTRVATTGMSALAVAQTVARATGNQIKTMEMLAGVNATIGHLIAETGRQLGSHVEQTTQFGQNPMLGIEQLKAMFDETFKAMDAMDTFRDKAVEVMERNNAIMKAEIARAETYLDRARQRQARDATKATLDGPVAL